MIERRVFCKGGPPEYLDALSVYRFIGRKFQHPLADYLVLLRIQDVKGYRCLRSIHPARRIAGYLLVR